MILYWQPVEPSSAIPFITTSRKEILPQKNAEGIESLIKSKLLTEDEKVLSNTLWWCPTVSPDFESRMRGRSPNSADEATFKSVVAQAACWVLSELAVE